MRSAALPRFSSKIPGFISFSILNNKILNTFAIFQALMRCGIRMSKAIRKGTQKSAFSEITSS